MSLGEKKIFNGVSLLDVSMDVLLKEIKSLSVAAADYMVTPNIDHFQRLDIVGSDLSCAYSNAKYVICDSRVVRALSLFEDKPITHVVPGSDLTASILADPWFRSRCIGIIGSTSREIKIIADRFQLADVKQYSPPMGFINNVNEIAKCVEFAKSANPEFLFLAVGCPQQEILASCIHKELSSLNTSIKLTFCVGASFDFLSGRVKRAPVWMQKSHLEWLYRALSDIPRLVPRYAGNMRWVLKYVFRRSLG